ncbi:MAG: potassium channel protein [Deltaproteobacteria bacterium]|nr:potassium channel protein [Deltaproteobacteria bacterium]MBW2537490.1 potassium channel protein [Deltaproteobacteria bacterium]
MSFLPTFGSQHIRQLYYGGPQRSTVVRGRLLQAGIALLVVFLLGTGGYWLIGHGDWSVMECAYMVLITITTVGYAEVLPVSATDAGRLFTMILLVSGMGTSVYFLSALTAFIVEGDLRDALWRRRMSNRLDKLRGHYIVCGTGETGRQVVAELVRAGRAVVAVELNEVNLGHVVDTYHDQVITILGDATEDDVLREASIVQAKGIFTTLESDQDNLYVTLSARQLNPDLRIVSRGQSPRSAAKLRQAGADSVISPARIGGRRMAHEMLRPNVVGFLDFGGRQSSQARNLCIEEIPLPAGSPLVGRKLSKSNIREASNALVLAVIEPNAGKHRYNPPPDFAFEEGQTLIVLGEREDVARLHRFINGEEEPR